MTSEDWPSVTTVLRPLFDATYGPLEEGGNEYTRRGAIVGDAMDVLVTGQTLHPDWLAWFNTHEKWIPYLEAGRKYLRENPPEEKPITQYRMYCKHMRVTGKPDWIWRDEGKITDVKTGASEPPAWLGMQTAPYAVMANELGGGVVFEKREILWLRDDGDYRIIPHENPHDEMDFGVLTDAWWVVKARL
jgi:hypothetical protein